MNRTLRLAVIFLAPWITHAAPMQAALEFISVPALPHGLDWAILVIPQTEPAQLSMSDEEAKNILPPPLHPPAAEVAMPLGAAQINKDVNPASTLAGLLAGSALLLIAYELIPRARCGFLRLRGLHLKQDLLT